jgi:hypothetical protein
MAKFIFFVLCALAGGWWLHETATGREVGIAIIPTLPAAAQAIARPLAAPEANPNPAPTVQQILCAPAAECPEWGIDKGRGDDLEGKVSGPFRAIASHSGDYAYIEGLMGATRSLSIHFMSISFALYDSGGARVGTATAYLTNLEPGHETRFKAFGVNEGGAETYKLVEVTGY